MICFTRTNLVGAPQHMPSLLNIVLYCIVLYYIVWYYEDLYWWPIRPLSYRHSSGVVRNPHSTLAEWGIFNLRSMSPQGTHLLIARRRNSINSVLVTISWITCLIATCEPRTINLSITGERTTFTMYSQSASNQWPYRVCLHTLKYVLIMYTVQCSLH